MTKSVPCNIYTGKLFTIDKLQRIKLVTYSAYLAEDTSAALADLTLSAAVILRASMPENALTLFRSLPIHSHLYLTPSRVLHLNETYALEYGVHDDALMLLLASVAAADAAANAACDACASSLVADLART